MAGPTTIIAHNSGGYRVEVDVGGHTIIGDEPTEFGGTDAGPDPYGLLVAAVGACTAMTVRMYAQRKQWPLGNVTITLKHSRSHAEDDRLCENLPVRLDQIDMVVQLDGELTPEQRARMLEIAARCPLHRTLGAGVRIAMHDAAQQP